MLRGFYPQTLVSIQMLFICKQENPLFGSLCLHERWNISSKRSGPTFIKLRFVTNFMHPLQTVLYASQISTALEIGRSSTFQVNRLTSWHTIIVDSKDCFYTRESYHHSNQILQIWFGRCSEFDIAAFVVFVGEVYKAAHQRNQWVFVTDSSISERYTEDFSDCLLAICFCSPHIDDDSFVPFNPNLVGSTVSKFQF